ncbi:MIP/aquaporin family protein [Nocardioides marmotae]|uniref:MIP/aquaporin family protein n=1 Tax=Nocardioides marmotae TaxID=2663857 RepID=UPI0012B5A11C|nr:aquaporin [Nocardioides marmotae]MBC9733682.1 aquaporin [Nocardioides marmotae]MTB84785.1 MIP family channel protein [Nocardioides marmotae]
MSTPSPTLPSTGQRIAAEAIGTFLLVLVAAGTLVRTDDALTAALAYGLAYAVAIAAFGRVSAHLNPAATVGSAVAGRTPWRDAGLLVGTQVVAGVLAALALFGLLHGYEGFDAEGSMGQNGFGDLRDGYAAWAAFLLEMILTALLVLVVLAVLDDRHEDRRVAPLWSGLALAALAAVAVPFTGASLNPARSIGPALFAGGDAILQLWVFLLAPLLGGLLAGLAYPFVLGRSAAPVPGSGLRLPARKPAAATSGQAAAQDWGGQEERPIIQDGWQWDPVAQEWKPAEQRWLTPQADPTQQQPWPGTSGTTGTTGDDSDGTQIR